jgi:hypothetical protein
MSEYQYYEFLAVDRPLTAAEQAEVRQQDECLLDPVEHAPLPVGTSRNR